MLSGNSDKNFEFADLVRLLELLGFTKRIKGSHHIFTRGDVDEIINIQSAQKLAKPYQVKQVRDLLIKYKFIPADES